MKKILVLLMICCMCTACGKKQDATVNVPEQTTQTVEDDTEEVVEEVIEDDTEEVVEEVVEEISEAAKILPLPTTIDVNAVDNCTLAVSFEKGDAYVDDTGAMQLDVTVYTYDLYDMVDIANLKEGDTIVILGNDVIVESLDTLDTGGIFINGGLDNGGYELWHDDSGVYFERGYDDVKSYYPIGDATIKVSTDFEFVDTFDFEKGKVTYYPGDFLTEEAGILYYFIPENTSIVVEDGYVTHMTRIYTP